MAYIATVTKKSVLQKKEDEFIITIHVSITDDSDSSVVLDHDYSVRYSTGWAIGDIKLKFQRLIQADWDKFLVEKALFDGAAFGTMTTQIQNALNTYIGD